MVLENDITAFLADRGEAKAKDIAAALGIDKGDVNRTLYQARGRLFRVDDTFKWSLQANSESSAAEVKTDARAQFSLNGDAPARESVLQARMSLARLKRGVPPTEGIEMLAVGMDQMGLQIGELFTEKPSSRWFAVTGEYGEGKSFFRAYACQRALSAGYAIASLDVNKDEGALHQPQRHLPVMFRSLQSPVSSMRSQLGISDLFRQWIATTPRAMVEKILGQLLNVTPWSPAGNDPSQFRFLVELALDMTSHVSHVGTIKTQDDLENATTAVDLHGFAYKRTPMLGQVYRRAPGATDWHFFGNAESWARVIVACKTYAAVEVPQAESFAPRSFAALTPYLALEDLAFKGSYTRFAAQYRFQLIVEWIRLTGHKGLFLFVDELDNVVRQINGRAHPGCFRSLAWYCSCPAIAPVRVTFATTPEAMRLLDDGCRDDYAEMLRDQISVRQEEYDVYCSWNRESGAHAKKGWAHCVTLNREQRVELFHRIKHIHDIAWGPSKNSLSRIVERLAISPSLDTTRRWVRAVVKILDLVKQNANQE